MRTLVTLLSLSCLTACIDNAFLEDLAGCEAPRIGLGDLDDRDRVENATCVDAPDGCGDVYADGASAECAELLCPDDDITLRERSVWTRSDADGGDIYVIACR